MNRFVAAARSGREFLLGDDWRVAVVVVCTLGLTAAVAAAGLPAWWAPPVLVLAGLARSVLAGAGKRPGAPAGGHPAGR